MKPALIAFAVMVMFNAQAEPIDLKGKLAEDYDWDAYFASGDGSTATQMIQAQDAVAILKRRMNELCKEYRDLMTKRGDLSAVKLFDTLQENWSKFAESEVAFVAASWEGGSGQKAAFPQHRFTVYMRRLKELRDLKGHSLFLNE